MVQRFEENVVDSFSIGNAEIPPGIYNFEGFTGVFQSPSSHPLILIFNTYLGTFFDGNSISLGLNPVWSPTPGFELGVRYEYNQGKFKERNQEYLIHLLGVKTTFMFSTKLSATLFVQYNSDDAEAVTNFRIRYNPREGNDLYIVYNDIMNTERYNVIPELPFYSTRALIVKYTYTFTWAR